MKYLELKNFIGGYPKGCPEEKDAFVKAFAERFSIKNDAIVITGTAIFSHRSGGYNGEAFGDPYVIECGPIASGRPEGVEFVGYNADKKHPGVSLIELSFDSADIIEKYVFVREDYKSWMYTSGWQSYARMSIVNSGNPAFWSAAVKMTALKAIGVDRA